MKAKSLQVIVYVVAISFFFNGKPYAQGFNVKAISDNVWIVSDPELGNQVVIKSEKGLVVFDSFWSEKTARIFKEEIAKTLGSRNFAYVINMTDRLDMIGGNAAYPEAQIVGHGNILTKFSGKESVQKEITELKSMWREKEGYSRSRLKNLEAGSEKALAEEKWMHKCITMADELENSFSLILPGISYNDRLLLDLGNTKIDLLWFGNAGNYQGLSVAVIPEEKLAILSKAILYPALHLAPYPQPAYAELDIPRWIKILEQLLEGEDAVENIILSDDDKVYSRELMQSHLNYIRKLWNSVKSLEAEGKTLPEIQNQLSLEKDFAFVKEMQVYKNTSDRWLRPQHELHVRLFYLQGRIHASEILKDGGPESLQTSLNKIKKLGSEVYFDETSIDFLGFGWMNIGKTSEAIEVYKLNMEAFPGSSKVYDSLGEAYLKIGDPENAIKSFKKSLEINPNNRYVSEKLKKLETK
ncbi:MAG: tetratricopeptide repeat protein [Candidatus Neomarinimicrobiota bacterium]